MPERKSFLKQIAEDFSRLSAGGKGAALGFALGLLLVIFGLWRTLFIILLTVIGYLLGFRIIFRYGSVREFLDKLFPPGFFR